MGFGDELMATGFARGASARGKRMAFGDPIERKISWTHNSKEIFKGNPNIAAPGSEPDDDLEWHPFRRGNRLYNHDDTINRRWVWNMNFRPVPGEVFFTEEELQIGASFGKGFVLLEPNVVRHKPSSQNKQWPVPYWTTLAHDLIRRGLDVRQLEYGGQHQIFIKKVAVRTFREALAVMQHASVVVTAEGGLHHGAAAVGCPAVVIFGSFIPPQVTGYDDHENISHGKPCGNYTGCDHCTTNMVAIKMEQVRDATLRILAKKEKENGDTGNR